MKKIIMLSVLLLGSIISSSAIDIPMPECSGENKCDNCRVVFDCIQLTTFACLPIWYVECDF